MPAIVEPVMHQMMPAAYLLYFQRATLRAGDGAPGESALLHSAMNLTMFGAHASSMRSTDPQPLAGPFSACLRERLVAAVPDRVEPVNSKNERCRAVQ